MAMGHKAQATNGGAMGGYQAIMFTPDGDAPATNGQLGGFYRGGSDHRKDGQVVAY
jgi:gamma-glutamyltranspeptidase/glutathione hydrolase